MKRSAETFSTTVVEERTLGEEDQGVQSQLSLKLKRPKQTLSASRRFAFELSQYSTQQEIVRILVEVEKELPLDTLEEVEFAIQSLWEHLYESKDVVIKAKIVSLLEHLARFPGANAQSTVENLMKLLSSEGVYPFSYLVFWSQCYIGSCKLYGPPPPAGVDRITCIYQVIRLPYFKDCLTTENTKHILFEIRVTEIKTWRSRDKLLLICSRQCAPST